MPTVPAAFADGRYLPLEKLGSGGMAEVWEVEDTRLGVRRALKVLPAGGVDAEPRARLLQEARILARIVHPHVVTVLDVGEEPDGRAWLVMELLPGGTLEAWVARNGPLHPREAGRVLLGVLDALGAAHAAGVIHRDVKPQNLLLAPDGRGGARLKLADFGIARLRDAHDLTRTGTLMGSWALMAPEQRLEARNVGPASDLFAAAGTLVWMVHGAPVSDLHVQEHRTMLLSGWPPTLAGVCHRALAFRPEQRFHSAAAFAEALRFALAQEEELEAAAPGSRPWAEGGFEVELGEKGDLVGGATAHPGAAQTGTAFGSDRRGEGHAPMNSRRLAAWALLVGAMGVIVGTVGTKQMSGMTRKPLTACPTPLRWVPTVRPGPVETVSASVSDVDGDKKLDVLFSNQGAGTVSVWWGTGTRTLAGPLTIPVGRASHAVALPDRRIVVTLPDENAIALVTLAAERTLARVERTLQGPSATSPISVGGAENPGVIVSLPLCIARRAVRTDRTLAPHECIAPASFLTAAGGIPVRWDGANWWNLAGDHLQYPPITPATHVLPISGGSPDLLAVTNDDVDRLDPLGARCHLGPAPRGTDLHAAADLDSDGALDLIGSRTCEGCTSNQIVLWGSPASVTR